MIPKEHHGLVEKNINFNALKVLRRLQGAGFEAFLVGGSIRDILLDKRPKDFDVATSAKPEQVRELFSNCRLIGRRFRLAHVYFHREIIEVATFRSQSEGNTDPSQKTNDQGMLIRDNVYGNLDEDALRRDFTVNALYYDIADGAIWDHTGGFADLKAKILRIIGEPQQRLQEDPVRILRALRLAAKLDLTVDKATEQHFESIGRQLQYVPNARLFDEVIKMFSSGNIVQGFGDWQRYHLLPYLFPMTDACLSEDDDDCFEKFINSALSNTDKRLREGKSVTPIFLLSVLLWRPFQEHLGETDIAMPLLQAIDLAADQTLRAQGKTTSIPKYFARGVKDIWFLQTKLCHLNARSIWRSFNHPRFRAGFDFLLLRGKVGDVDPAYAAWWQDFQDHADQDRAAFIRDSETLPLFQNNVNEMDEVDDDD